MVKRIFLNKEIWFQVILHIVVFTFYSFDRRNPEIQTYKYVFFLNFVLAGLVVNYVLLPKFLYSGAYLKFALYVGLVAGCVIFIEEAILEKIYFPDTRGKRFLGVGYNLMGTLPTLSVLAGFKFGWDALIKQKEVKELKDSVKESELQFLKSQINPHFLFNNMNNLYSYAIEKSPRTPELILELSGVLRYMLYECKAKYVSLSKEVEQLENFINLGRLQIEGRGSVTFSKNIIQSNFWVAPLILIVFVENALKHGGSSQTSGIIIDVDIEVTENGLLYFNCSNTYKTQANINNLDSGIGLENVKKRLDIIYPKAHTLQIKANKKTYKVELTIDLKKSREQ
ncbi:sensor histidine kinase [Aquimarina celericrescens]|uniref:Sensor histidine kinase n=1 Tax=Aquimarina celericrescens TaxID=1964542 RepID=A0ABW5AWT4_9FLAO|nr:histidine kinase [Aquimarina celericrescens]